MYYSTHRKLGWERRSIFLVGSYMSWHAIIILYLFLKLKIRSLCGNNFEWKSFRYRNCISSRKKSMFLGLFSREGSIRLVWKMKGLAVECMQVWLVWFVRSVLWKIRWWMRIIFSRIKNWNRIRRIYSLRDRKVFSMVSLMRNSILRMKKDNIYPICNSK